MKKTVFTILFAIVILLALILQGATQTAFAKNVVRLHIIANSDSVEDQNVKLLVRDAILHDFGCLSGVQSKDEFEQKLQNNLPHVTAAANQVLKENGFDYCARAEYGVYEFPSRTYGDVTLPAGKYYGLRVHLGSGAGKNWWCVMYPPLCFNEASTTITDTDEDKITLEIKFKLLEWLKSR